MHNLLSANFARMKKDNVFWICVMIMFIMGVSVPVYYFFEMNKFGSVYTLDSGLFSFSMALAVLLAIFCPLFIGTEYSDGTMRNKVMIGCTRGHIYSANLLVCFLAALIMCISFWAPYLCVGLLLLDFFESNVVSTVLLVVCVIAVLAALTAIFTMISMLNQNKTIVSVICILSAFFMLFAGLYLDLKLSEPEYYENYTYLDENGDARVGETQKNPNYISGIKRKGYEFLYNFTSGGQMFQINRQEIDNWPQIVCYSALMVLISTGVGITAFRKKDLR